MFDTHVHSTFSPDGKSTILEYAQWMDNGWVEGIGFAEHLDFLPECGAYGFMDYHGYIQAIKRYRDRGYRFYAGAEVDYAKSVEKDILLQLEETPYEYTICSVHMIQGLTMSDRNISHFFDRSLFLGLLEDYYRQIESCIRVEKFDVLGHIGVYKRYLENEFFQEGGLYQHIEELEDEIARMCAESDKIVEVNSSGLFATVGTPVPTPFFLNAYYGYGGRKISIGSDAHQSAHVARGFRRVQEVVRAIGFEYTWLPWDRENPVKLLEK